MCKIFLCRMSNNGKIIYQGLKKLNSFYQYPPLPSDLLRCLWWWFVCVKIDVGWHKRTEVFKPHSRTIEFKYLFNIDILISLLNLKCWTVGLMYREIVWIFLNVNFILSGCSVGENASNWGLQNNCSTDTIWSKTICLIIYLFNEYISRFYVDEGNYLMWILSILHVHVLTFDGN